jgi:RNA polymerase sigma factor (sigma-70 family)
VTRPTNADLLSGAASGDRQAWDQVVERYQRLIWSVIRTYRLDPASAADVVQTVWLRLIENLSRIREPDKLGSWLATTARNEALRLSRSSRRMVPTEFETDVVDIDLAELDDRLLEDELQQEVMAAFRQLRPEHQHLLRLLCVEPPLDYPTIAELWGRPQGSIGPTKARCVDQMLRIMGRHRDLGKQAGERA